MNTIYRMRKDVVCSVCGLVAVSMAGVHEGP